MVLVNLGFHTRKNFFENFPQFERAPSKIFVSPVLGRKSFKEGQIISLPGTPTSVVILCIRRFLYSKILYSAYRERLYVRYGSENNIGNVV